MDTLAAFADRLNRAMNAHLGDPERADFVTCLTLGARPLFADNILTTCALCGTWVQHRPTAPKRPPKVCVGCAEIVVRTDDAPKN